jgi:hypothetical protein
MIGVSFQLSAQKGPQFHSTGMPFELAIGNWQLTGAVSADAR